MGVSPEKTLNSGGFGLPVLIYTCICYLFSLLTAHSWVVMDHSNASVVLKAAHLGTYEAYRNILLRATNVPLSITPPMRAVISAWTQVNPRLASASKSRFPHTPLWLNPTLFFQYWTLLFEHSRV